MQFLLLAAACFAGAEIGQRVVGAGAPPLAAYWPPTGVLLGVLLVRERRTWAPLVVVAVAATWLSLLLHAKPLPVGAAVALVTGLDALLAALLIRVMLRGTIALDRVTHTAAALLAAVIVPTGGALLIASLEPTPTFAAAWLSWWLAQTVGLVVTALLVVTMLRAESPSAHIAGSRALELAVVTALTLAVAHGIFGGIAPAAFRVPAYILPFLLWPAIRFGLAAASVSVFSVCALVLWHATNGATPLAQLAGGDALPRSQGGIIAAAASVLLLASIVSERKRIAAERDVLVTELQQALAEIKTLRGLIPICAWCHKIRDDAGFWQELEEYLDERTDATFSHGICPACVQEQTGEIDAHHVRPGA